LELENGKEKVGRRKLRLLKKLAIGLPKNSPDPEKKLSNGKVRADWGLRANLCGGKRQRDRRRKRKKQGGKTAWVKRTQRKRKRFPRDLTNLGKLCKGKEWQAEKRNIWAKGRKTDWDK